DLFDLIGFGAAGRNDFHVRTFGLADERARKRRRDRNLALLGVGLGLTDDLPHSFLVSILVDQRDRGAEFDGVAGEFGDIDHLGAREPILKLGDAAFVERLLLLGGVVLSVLRQVAVRARVGDLLDDARALDLLAVPELVLQNGITR